MIRMKHEQHGEMDVYSDVEVAANEKTGWTVVKATEPQAQTSNVGTQTVAAQPAPATSVPDEVKRGPGRPRKDAAI